MNHKRGNTLSMVVVAIVIITIIIAGGVTMMARNTSINVNESKKTVLRIKLENKGFALLNQGIENNLISVDLFNDDQDPEYQIEAELDSSDSSLLTFRIKLNDNSLTLHATIKINYDNSIYNYNIIAWGFTTWN